MPREILETQGEICEYLGWGWRKVMRMIQIHDLPVVKLDGRWTAHTDNLDAWLRARATPRDDAA